MLYIGVSGLISQNGSEFSRCVTKQEDWSSNQQNQSKILYVKTIFDYVSLFFGLIKTISNCKSKCFTRKFNNSIIAVRKIQLGMIKSYLQIHFATVYDFEKSFLSIFFYLTITVVFAKSLINIDYIFYFNGN